jgi:membrane protein YdbS with pleckstrin-like domain
MTVETMSEQLQRITEGEDVFWHAKPDKKAFILTRGLIYLVLLLVLVPSFFIFGSVLSFVGLTDVIILPVGVAGITALLFLLFAALIRNQYNHLEYAVTDDRLIQFSGIIGRNYSTVKWEDVQDFETKVGPIDKIFGTGTITARPAGASSTSHQGITYECVKHPYTITEELNDHV